MADGKLQMGVVVTAHGRSGRQFQCTKHPLQKIRGTTYHYSFYIYFSQLYISTMVPVVLVFINRHYFNDTSKIVASTKYDAPWGCDAIFPADLSASIADYYMPTSIGRPMLVGIGWAVIIIDNHHGRIGRSAPTGAISAPTGTSQPDARRWMHMEMLHEERMRRCGVRPITPSPPLDPPARVRLRAAGCRFRHALHAGPAAVVWRLQQSRSRAQRCGAHGCALVAGIESEIPDDQHRCVCGDDDDRIYPPG